MRSLYSDAVYFDYLDSVRAECECQPRLVAMKLLVEFPMLRSEEAFAVCCDWQASRRAGIAGKRDGMGAA